MGRSADPATLVLCAMLPKIFPRGARAAWLADVGRARVPVTWAADVDLLAELGTSSAAPAPAMALALEPDWLDSRSTLRRMIGVARQAVNGLETAVLRGPRPLSHAAVLAEEGIRVVVADTLDDSRRGSRRPAPAGWRCRNPVWGLWEVQAETRHKAGLMRWLLHGSMPRPRPGALHVLQAGRVAAERPVSGRLDRWIAWAERRLAGGRVRVTTADDLPALAARGGQAAFSGSVLKAA
jgi:hypothetical protein